jgi:probable biosynthetic protein (TIGR04098 family)
MATTTIELQVKDLLARLTRIGADEIDVCRKAAHYGLDSMGQLEFRELLERTFQIYLDDRTFTRFDSISQLIDYVNSSPRAQSTDGIACVSNSLGTNGNLELLRKSRLSGSGVLYDDIEIGMSLTCLNNLAESPLLKYLGDLRWRHLSALSGVPSKLFADDKGQRLYPSFFYVEMAFPNDRPMASYGENDSIKVASSLKRFGGSMLDGFCYLLPTDYTEDKELPFAGIDEAVAAGVPAIRLSNIFVEQHRGAEWLRTARPFNPGFQQITELAIAPESYVRMKTVEKGDYLSSPGNAYVPLTEGPVKTEYRLVVDRDFSSTGLVYFANYPMFLDICEREALAGARFRLPEELLNRRTIVRRQSAYLNNATPQETLIVEIEPWLENPVMANHPAPEVAPIRLFLNYRMRRKSDGKLMMVSSAEKMIFGVPFQELPFCHELIAK